MLTIGKIGGAGKGHWRTPEYYTQQVAQGAEDYYSGKGEAPGTWTGTGAANLGLTGELQDGELQALFQRRHPITGDQLGRPPGVDSVKGIDVQMAVPKSVSTLWALADDYGQPEVGAAVWEATNGAGRAALDYLERHACTSRAGKGGHIRLKGEGFIGAAFPHRFSRAGDPQVHVHFLIANMTRCGDPERGVPDGCRTLDARDIYRHQVVAGYVFQAELRERLTRELGVEWSEVHKGAAEVVGVPRPLSLALSKRRAQIIDKLDGRAGTAREAEIAALSTRKGKREFDLAEQRTHWRAVAQEHGFGPDEFADTIGRVAFRDLDRQEIAATVEELIGPNGLTRERSTFTRRELVQDVAAAHGRGGSVGRIEELADRLIASDQIVAVDGPADAAARLRGRSTGERAEALFTTPDMLALEAAMVDQAAGRVGEGAGVVRSASVEGGGFARRPGGLVFSDEQQQMVGQLVTSGHGIDIVRARAGTGKTTAIDAARELWEREGYRVIGGALAGRAADELRARGGIDSYTIHGLLHDLDRGGDYGLADRTVLVVDEAGMVGSRQLSRLLDHAAEANAKVVLIGDERQLAAVEAGGGFKALADRLGAIELKEVYRQEQAWDRAALDELRHGDISEWIAAYDQHGRLVPCQGADDQLQTLASDWYVATREHGLVETQMFAATREDAHALNQLGRATRVAAGELDDTAALAVGDRLFAQGDRVLALRNEWVDTADRPGKHQLRNGNRATVTAIDRDAGALHVRLDHGPEVVLSNDYLADGRLSHGYAQTIHKAQGMTIRQDFVLASPDVARELGYVAASRHTDSSRFYVNVGQDVDLDRPQLPGLEDEPLYKGLERALGVERAKQLAVDVTEIDADLGELTTAQLIEIRDRGQTVLSTIPRHARRARDGELLERAASNASHLEELLTNARDELDSLNGRRDRQRRTALEQRAQQLEQALDLARAEVADRTDAAAATDPAHVIADHEMEIVDAAAAERELAARRADAHWRATRTAALDADPAIERELGERPDSPTDREQWEQAAAAQESYRLQYGALPHEHDVDDLTGRQAADWNHAIEIVEALFDAPVPDLTPDRATGGPDFGL
jgi:Ti-type conjugative transfer relaxase TraA